MFLGFALYSIWKDLKLNINTSLPDKIPGLTLTSSQDNKKNSFQNQKVIVIGRQKTSDLQVDDLTISNQHAQLSYHHKQWWLKDLNSTNGTILNNMKVESSVVVMTGDEIRCGNQSWSIDIQSKMHKNKNESRGHDE